MPPRKDGTRLGHRATGLVLNFFPGNLQFFLTGLVLVVSGAALIIAASATTALQLIRGNPADAKGQDGHCESPPVVRRVLPKLKVPPELEGLSASELRVLCAMYRLSRGGSKEDLSQRLLRSGYPDSDVL